MSSEVESRSQLLKDSGIDAEVHQETLANAQGVSKLVRIPLSNTNWSGSSGNWQGAGIGSSIDFQDHRQYVPGDDPRYINWQAYARTGSYTMKLYREEVSPKVDLVLDVSSSMFLGAAKARRTLELFYFIVSSARAAGTLLRCYQVSSSKVKPIGLDAIDTNCWDLLDGDGGDREFSKGERSQAMPIFRNVPWRVNAMCVVISDLLFPVSPDGLLGGLRNGRGGLLLFCPWSREEAEPGWNGNVELEDCELKSTRDLRFTQTDLKIYRQRYRKHFSLWQQLLVKRGYRFARVASDGKLQDAILKEPLEAGMVELWN